MHNYLIYSTTEKCKRQTGKQVGTNLLPYSRRSRCQKKKKIMNGNSSAWSQYLYVSNFYSVDRSINFPTPCISIPAKQRTYKRYEITKLKNGPPLYKLSTSGMFSFFIRCFERFLSPSCSVYSLRQNLCLWQNVRSVRKIGEKKCITKQFGCLLYM